MTVDIYIPFAGDFEYFKQSVASVIAQSDEDWRLTVVDDRGTDDTDAEEHLRALAGEYGDQKVRYHRNERNLGVAGAHNRCLEIAFSDELPKDHETLVTFLGADDVLLPNFVGDSRKAHRKHPDVAFMQPGVETVDKDLQPVTGLADRVKSRLTKPITEPVIREGEGLARGLLVGNYLYTPALSFKKSALRDTEGNRRSFPELEFGEDLIMFLDIVADGGKLLLTPEPAVRCRRHEASITGRMTADGTRFPTERRMFAMAKAMMKERGWVRAAQAAGAHWTSRANAAAQAAKLVASLRPSNKNVGGQAVAVTKTLGQEGFDSNRLAGLVRHVVTRELPMEAKDQLFVEGLMARNWKAATVEASDRRSRRELSGRRLGRRGG